MSMNTMSSAVTDNYIRLNSWVRQSSQKICPKSWKCRRRPTRSR
jgi:hypothetical protein